MTDREQKAQEYLFPPSSAVSLEITGSNKRFPVRRIYCIGLNYPRPARLPERAAALQNQAEGTSIIFDKHLDAIVEDRVDIPYPQSTSELGYEVELVIAIGKKAVNVDADSALDHVFGYAIGNDLTRRDLMIDALASGGTVDVGKAFDGSAPCGPIHPVAVVGHLHSGRIWLTVDGDLKQEGDLKDMQKKPGELITELSHLYHLLPGDLIYTGTPGHSGTIRTQQTMVCGIYGLGTLTNKII